MILQQYCDTSIIYINMTNASYIQRYAGESDALTEGWENRAKLT